MINRSFEIVKVIQVVQSVHPIWSFYETDHDFTELALSRTELFINTLQFQVKWFSYLQVHVLCSLMNLKEVGIQRKYLYET